MLQNYLFILFSLTILPLWSQPKFTTDDLVFNQHHFSFKANFLINTVQQQIDLPQGHFEALAKKGGSVGGSLVVNPYPKLGLEIGANISLQTFGYFIQFDAATFQLEETVEAMQVLPELYFELPLMAISRLKLTESNWLEVKTGLNLNWYVPLNIDFNLEASPTTPASPDLGEVSFNFNGDNPYFHILSGICWQHLTKSKDLIGLNLAVNFGFKPVLEGKYSIWNNGQLVGSGSFSSKGSYVALGLSYTFTGAKALESKLNKRALSD